MIFPYFWDTPGEAGGIVVILLIILIVLGTGYQYRMSRYFYERYRVSEKLDISLVIILFLTFACIPLLIPLRYLIWANYQAGHYVGWWEYLNPQESFNNFLRETDSIGAIIPFFLGFVPVSLKNRAHVLCAASSLVGYFYFLIFSYIPYIFWISLLIFLATSYEYSLLWMLYEKSNKFRKLDKLSLGIVAVMSVLFLYPALSGGIQSILNYPLLTLLPFLIALGAFLFNLHLRNRGLKACSSPP